jgi:hypothetical protein
MDDRASVRAANHSSPTRPSNGRHGVDSWWDILIGSDRQYPVAVTGWQHRHGSLRRKDSTEGHEGRLVPVRVDLLPPLPPGRAWHSRWTRRSAILDSAVSCGSRPWSNVTMIADRQNEIDVERFSDGSSSRIPAACRSPSITIDL